MFTSLVVCHTPWHPGTRRDCGSLLLSGVEQVLQPYDLEVLASSGALSKTFLEVCVTAERHDSRARIAAGWRPVLSRSVTV